MASEPPDEAERELLGRLAARVTGEFEHLLVRMGEHLEHIDEIAGDRAEVQDELADGRQLLARGGALLRQLAAFGGQRSLAPERRELRTRVGNWWPRLQRAIGHQHFLELHLRGVPVALIDDEALAFALEHLCLNARDASPPEGVIELHVGSPPEQADPDWVVLELIDHGAGMDAETRARALEAFFTTKPRRVGLGLSAARAIVEAHGGQLSLRSSPGEGTSVTIRLPAAGSELEQPLTKLAPVRVLVVGAERLIVRWMRRSLSSKGCEVRVAGGVLDTREQLRGDWPEVIIVDRNLPDGDGRSLALELGTERPERPLLFASSAAQLRRDRDRGLPRLPDSVILLHRPFSTRRFDELIGGVLAQLRAPV